MYKRIACGFMLCVVLCAQQPLEARNFGKNAGIAGAIFATAGTVGLGMYWRVLNRRLAEEASPVKKHLILREIASVKKFMVASGVVAVGSGIGAYLSSGEEVAGVVPKEKEEAPKEEKKVITAALPLGVAVTPVVPPSSTPRVLPVVSEERRRAIEQLEQGRARDDIKKENPHSREEPVRKSQVLSAVPIHREAPSRLSSLDCPSATALPASLSNSRGVEASAMAAATPTLNPSAPVASPAIAVDDSSSRAGAGRSGLDDAPSAAVPSVDVGEEMETLQAQIKEFVARFEYHSILFLMQNAQYQFKGNPDINDKVRSLFLTNDGRYGVTNHKGGSFILTGLNPNYREFSLRRLVLSCLGPDISLEKKYEFSPAQLLSAYTLKEYASMNTPEYVFSHEKFERLNGPIPTVLSSAVALCERRGWRADMEDAAIVRFDQDKRLAAFFICDGHGGTALAEYCSKNLFNFLVSQGVAEDTSNSALQKAVIAFDDHDSTKAIAGNSGTTLSGFMIEGADRIQVINLGDSRTIFFSADGVVIYETSDHEPDKECVRVEQAGGWVERSRVNKYLAVSRALGDFDLKKTSNEERLADRTVIQNYPVSNCPDVSTFSLADLIARGARYALVACDGVWNADKKSFDSARAAATVVDYFRKGKKLDEVSILLTGKCRNSGDNVSAMLVDLVELKEALSGDYSSSAAGVAAGTI